MFELSKSGFDKENIISYGNMFLIGNGHLGYRGTLEEYSKDEMIGLNVCGFYDRYKKLWRESINMPNPFHVVVSSFDKVFSMLETESKEHNVVLDLKHAIFKRHTEFEGIIIDSSRFISCTIDNLLCFKYSIRANKNIDLNIKLGVDTNIFECNGPHFKRSRISRNGKTVIFKGMTNEGRPIAESAQYIFKGNEYEYAGGVYSINVSLIEGESYDIYCISRIFEDGIYKKERYSIKEYGRIKREHMHSFESKWDNALIKVKGDERSQFALNYSIYHLLILGNETYETSIPARGVSGSVYKGAIFWDTEIFMVPFFTCTNEKIARKLLKYRINTLKGALGKAKEYGHEGAFFAWESQEKGQEGCSKYNVTDPDTGKPIRTYFNEKQIHISADIVYAIERYMNVSGDYSLLNDGALELMREVSRFFISYSKYRDGMYHIDDVIGPDEYHERINDNAFTSYMARFAIKTNIKYLDDNDPFKKELEDYLEKLYVTPVGSDGLLEQFDGYFKKEDVLVDDVRKRIRNPKEYWGGKKGVATPTRVIKQADVIALMVLLGEEFDTQSLRCNFDFYFKYTEHGSSLSSSMYSIAASRIGLKDEAYQMFLKSAEIDLGTNQKQFAGGIYIGGTHPASSAGAYLSVVYGMAGLEFYENGFALNPNLPKAVKGLEFKIRYKGKTYNVSVGRDKYSIKEENL